MRETSRDIPGHGERLIPARMYTYTVDTTDAVSILHASFKACSEGEPCPLSSPSAVAVNPRA